MELQLWKEILGPYRQAVDELLVKFNHIIEDHHNAGLYSPIEQVKGRVKSISSILEKLQRKNQNINELEEKIEDLAGIRILCQFVEDIDKVVQIIENRSDMEIKSIKDYIANAKDSGYRSYHMIIYYDVNTIHGVKRVQAEIQIRTLAMDFWATVEHSLAYKYQGNIPEEIRARLSGAADALLLLDHEMSSVRNVIMDAQASNKAKETLVADILSNIQNLYKVANKREIVKIQDEFYKVYQGGDFDELSHFGKQLDIIAEGYRAQSIS